jgi:hypothetical protein
LVRTIVISASARIAARRPPIDVPGFNAAVRASSGRGRTGDGLARNDAVRDNSRRTLRFARRDGAVPSKSGAKPARSARPGGGAGLDTREETLVTDVMDRPSVRTYQQLIGGASVASASGETLDIENPANGQVIAKVPASSAEDVDRAVEAAE